MSAALTFVRDEYLATLDPPRLDIGGGRVLVGRVLSADEWFRFEERLQLASGDKLTRVGLRALMQEMTDVTFAPLISGRWLFRRTRPVSSLLFELPFAGQLAAFQSFTLAQAAAQQGTTPRAKTHLQLSRTHGTRSSG